jgi:hypothetical protein
LDFCFRERAVEDFQFIRDPSEKALRRACAPRKANI